VITKVFTPFLLQIAKMEIYLNNKKDYTHVRIDDSEWFFNCGIFNGIFESDNALLENYQILFEEEYMKILRSMGFKHVSDMKVLAINYSTSKSASTGYLNKSASQLLLKSIRDISKILKIDAIAYATGLTEVDHGIFCQIDLENYFSYVAQTGILIMDPNKRFPSSGLHLV